MAFDNTATVVGNVTRDPEHKVTNGGMSIANFGIAWNKRKQDGEDETSFFDVSTFRQLADNVVSSIKKVTVLLSAVTSSRIVGPPLRARTARRLASSLTRSPFLSSGPRPPLRRTKRVVASVVALRVRPLPPLRLSRTTPTTSPSDK